MSWPDFGASPRARCSLFFCRALMFCKLWARQALSPEDIFVLLWRSSYWRKIYRSVFKFSFHLPNHPNWGRISDWENNQYYKAVPSLGSHDLKIWQSIFFGLTVFLSSSVKLGWANPVGSVKKMAKIGPAELWAMAMFEVYSTNPHIFLSLVCDQYMTTIVQ